MKAIDRIKSWFEKILEILYVVLDPRD